MTVLCCLGIAGALWLLPSVSFPAIILIALGLLFGPPAGVLVALPASVLPPDQRSLGTGAFYTWYHAAIAGLMPLAGLLRDVYGQPAAPIWFGSISACLAVVALLAFQGMRSHRHRALVSPAAAPQARP